MIQIGNTKIDEWFLDKTIKPFLRPDNSIRVHETTETSSFFTNSLKLVQELNNNLTIFLLVENNFWHNLNFHLYCKFNLFLVISVLELDGFTELHRQVEIGQKGAAEIAVKIF